MGWPMLKLIFGEWQYFVSSKTFTFMKILRPLCQWCRGSFSLRFNLPKPIGNKVGNPNKSVNNKTSEKPINLGQVFILPKKN